MRQERRDKIFFGDKRVKKNAKMKRVIKAITLQHQRQQMLEDMKLYVSR